ncbi:hypothetical protein F5144DRAFT_548192 [Chaetomium tenue]|uniref:Uncharacterized protein n=1 Tax=Chaetomium tenue TaxID=1854479 RepID=A0ACB7P7H7_9PEZI|nr:hypothetical protein F5144DRAFT_548192 [Chaetomium globosum]
MTQFDDSAPAPKFDICKRNAGPFAECVVSEVYVAAAGSCAGCHYSSGDKRCIFNTNKSQAAPQVESAVHNDCEDPNEDIEEYIKKMEANLAAAKEKKAVDVAKAAELTKAAAAQNIVQGP